MQFSAFSAFCPYEIGDKIKDLNDNLHTITDIASVHYLKKQNVEFRYELDNNARYVSLKVVGVG
jgi:hypothetical protein